MNTQSNKDALAELEFQLLSISAHETCSSIEIYQRYLQLALNADRITWCAFYRGPFGRSAWYTQVMDDWKVFEIKFPIGFDLDLDEVKAKFYAKARKEGGLGEGIKSMVEAAGVTRAQTVEDSMPYEEWGQHWEYELWQKQGIEDRMSGAFVLSPISESHVWIDRNLGKPRFDKQDKEKLVSIMNKFPRLQYWWMLERGLVEPAVHPLSPREKEVLKLLLHPISEAQIAEQLDLAKGTVHNYITGLFKLFQVSSRHELIQLWLK